MAFRGNGFSATEAHFQSLEYLQLGQNKVNNEFSMFIKRVLRPFRFKALKHHLPKKPLRVLDVGCGANSHNISKLYLSIEEYHGLDKQVWHGDESSYSDLDRLFEIDLDDTDLSAVANNEYDLILLSHVIEHLEFGERVIALLVEKLKIGGVIYIETPSEKTLAYPSADGFLNFYDDDTHKRMYFHHDIVHRLQASKMKILSCGIRRDSLRILTLAPLGIMLNLLWFLPFKRRLWAVGLWDLLGVARFWIAKKI